jgi:hypothetical protein
MRARTFLLLSMTLTPWLASCEAERAPPLAAVSKVLARETPAARKAEIRRQLAPLCPAPLGDGELERAAAYVETHRDKGAIWLVGRLSRMDAETRVCRNEK